MAGRISLANIYAIVAWLTALSLAAGFLLLDKNPGPQQFAIPLLFWTFYGALVVIATACAIALPTRQAVFCRALVLSLLALTVLASGDEPGRVFDALVDFLPRASQKLFYSLWSRDYWIYLAAMGMTYLLCSLICASCAWGMARRWPEVSRERYPFRLWHLFALSALVACTLAALRVDSPLSGRLTVLSCASLRLIMAMLAASYRRPALFCWAYLAGDFTWCLLIESRGLFLEWYGWLPAGFAPQYGVGMIQLLLPTYAGIAVGILSVTLGRPESATEKPRD